MTMFNCHVCGNSSAKSEYVSEIFTIEGRRVLVEHVPAEVCTRCGERVFSRETTEKIRVLVHGSPAPARTETLEVFELA
jgi:HTH-type transcriptional regulator / antitoxin MqsA